MAHTLERTLSCRDPEIAGRLRFAGIAQPLRLARLAGLTRIVRLATLAVAVAVLASPRAVAHDFWLEPAATSVQVGERVDVATVVGVAFRGDRVGRDPVHLERFFAADALGESELDGEPGRDPSGRFIARAPGTTIVAYRSKLANLYLRAPEFEKYLVEEGLERIVALRAERGQSRKMGLEHYSRCAKALVQVGPAGAAPLRDHELGLPLELVALGDPLALAAGGELEVRLTFRGKPLEGALVMALERDHPDVVVKLRSDADGRVRLPIAGGGPSGSCSSWMVKAVHMVEAPRETRLDWESFWASLTFAVPIPAMRGDVRRPER